MDRGAGSPPDRERWLWRLTALARERWGAERAGAIGAEIEATARAVALVAAAELEPADPAPSVVLAAIEAGNLVRALDPWGEGADTAAGGHAGGGASGEVTP